ncbi:MAG: M48 family metalloprotease [Gallionella sp.]|nr:M48 family metalloprotease [Gallionella sp.]
MKNIRGLENRLGTRVLSMAAVALFTIHCSSLPAFAEDDFRKRVNQEPESFATDDDVKAEIVFGRTLAARILGKYAFYENGKLNEYVNKIGKGMAQFANRPEIEFRFAVIDTDIVNAFAAPGGYIFITKGAMARMADEAELAAVISHEIAHVTEKHIVKELNIKGTDASPVSGFAQLLGGGSGAARVVFSQMVDQAAEILFEKGLKKQDEFDSDKVATMTLAVAGYDPTALKRYLKKISGAEKETKSLTGTHPSFKERIENVDAVLAENQLTENKQAIVKERFNQNVRFN